MSNKKPKISNVTRTFLTGLLVTIPIFITIYVLKIIIEVGGGFFDPIYDLIRFIAGRISGNPDIKIPYHPVIGFVLMVLLILWVGSLAKNIVGKGFLKFIENTLKSVPLTGKIYLGAKEISDALLGNTQRKVFQRVVIVDYPIKGVKTLAFVTNEKTIIDRNTEDYISVFVPTTPNITTGYFLMYRAEDVIEVDLKVDEALKLIISAGALEKS